MSHSVVRCSRRAAGVSGLFYLHGDDLRENGLGDGEQDGQQPDRDCLQTRPEDGTGRLDVHRVHDGLVPDGHRERRALNM